MHLPISLDKPLHLYKYFSTYVLIAEGQFLLLINVPIQNRAQKLHICEVFNFLSAKYKINHRYIGVTYDETKAFALMDQQYIAYQHGTPLESIIMYNSPIC